MHSDWNQTKRTLTFFGMNTNEMKVTPRDWIQSKFFFVQLEEGKDGFYSLNLNWSPTNNHHENSNAKITENVENQHSFEQTCTVYL